MGESKTVQMTTDELKQIEDLAGLATKDGWDARIQTMYSVGYEPQRTFSIGPIHMQNPRGTEVKQAMLDAEYSAALNPQTCLRLLEYIRTLEAVIAKWQATWGESTSRNASKNAKIWELEAKVKNAREDALREALDALYYIDAKPGAKEGAE